MPYKFIEDERANKKAWWEKNKHKRKEYKKRWAEKKLKEKNGNVDGTRVDPSPSRRNVSVPKNPRPISRHA